MFSYKFILLYNEILKILRSDCKILLSTILKNSDVNLWPVFICLNKKNFSSPGNINNDRKFRNMTEIKIFKPTLMILNVKSIYNVYAVYNNIKEKCFICSFITNLNVSKNIFE